MKRNIWHDEYPSKGATDRQIQLAEKRLDVRIPASLRRQLKIQNGGQVCNTGEFSAADGIMPVQRWELAEESDWFADIEEIENQSHLVIFARHSESHSCFDYRKSGKKRVPGVIDYFIGCPPYSNEPDFDSVDDWVQHQIEAKDYCDCEEVWSQASG